MIAGTNSTFGSPDAGLKPPVLQQQSKCEFTSHFCVVVDFDVATKKQKKPKAEFDVLAEI